MSMLGQFGPRSAGFYSPDMLGPGLLGEYATSVFDAYDRIRFGFQAAINGQVLDFFQTPVGQPYNAIGTGAVTQIQKTPADTNWDLTGQTQYGYIFEGISVQFHYLSALRAAAANNDSLNLEPFFNLLIADTSVELKVNDTSMDRLTVSQAPGAGGPWSSSAMTGTEATAFANQTLSNGVPHASNYKSYAQNPLWVPINQRLKVSLTFGDSVLAALVDFATVGNEAPLAWVVRLIGRRVTPVGG